MTILFESYEQGKWISTQLSNVLGISFDHIEANTLTVIARDGSRTYYTPVRRLCVAEFDNMKDCVDRATDL